jgi:hypothetical protein
MRGRSKERIWSIREISERESKRRKKEGKTLKERKVTNIVTLDTVVAISKVCLVFTCDQNFWFIG